VTFSYFVKFNHNGFVAATKSMPRDLGKGEFVVETEMEVDDSAFAPIEIAKAKISVPAEALRRRIVTDLQEPGS